MNKTVLVIAFMIIASSAFSQESIAGKKAPSQNPAYSFSIQKHQLGMLVSYHQANPYNISVLNKDLENMLDIFYGINRSRIISNDTSLLKTKYDLTFKADNEIMSEANFMEMLKLLLLKHLDMQMTEIKKDTLAGTIVIANDSLLNTHLSKYPYPGITFRFDNWEAKAATLVKLKDFLENQFNILINVYPGDDRKFDFIISATDLEKTKKTLEKDYGISIRYEMQKTTFWKIKKSNQ